MIVLIVGLPGAGKTSLAQELVSRTGAIHLNADAVRADLNSDLGFTTTDRLEQARRMGSMARLLSAQGFLDKLLTLCDSPFGNVQNAAVQCMIQYVSTNSPL